MPMYGPPWEIPSDNGSHFTGNKVQLWATDNGVQWTLHILSVPGVGPPRKGEVIAAGQ